jgi:cytochrome c oxidase assembly factor CtaG
VAEPALAVLGSLAHGAPPPSPGSGALAAWPFEPLLWASCAAAIAMYLRAARRVAAWPRTRTPLFLSGVAIAFVALGSPLAVYADALFSVHMVQHLLLTLVAAPLVVLGAPAALAWRAWPGWRRRGSALVHAAPVRALTHPVVAWVVFVVVMWASHFSALYDAALENDAVHTLEHGLFFGAALLFWWPVAGLDPGAAGRLSPPARLLYLVAALPQQSFLGVALMSAGSVLYPHYATLARSWGPDPLADQEVAGVLMWVVGDALFIGAVVVAILAWMRSDAREARRVDRRLEAG